MKRKRVLLGEDSEIIALGFIRILEGSALFEVVAHVERFDKIEERIVTCKPDIVVVNPMLSGAVKADGSINTFEGCSIVAIVHNYVEQNILKQYQCTIDIGDNRNEIESKLKSALSQNSDQEEKRSSYELSDRETDILVAVAKGLQNKEIADTLNISIHTVISHRKNIVAKTGIRSVAGLTVYALINNLINESDVM